MSDEEFDITKSLLNPESDSESSESDSDSGFGLEGEVQDVISDDEGDEDKSNDNKTKAKSPSKPSTKEQNNSTANFPSLELSDDEDEGKKKSSMATDLSSYFVNHNPNVKKAKAGTFQSFGFSKMLLGNIAKKGFKQPTPIQRKSIPLIMDNRDVVGMARTGSGKTAAFTLPLIEKLKTHSAQSGARAIILAPSRELAMQTFRLVKEFGSKTNLRAILLVGGDSLEDQFSAMMSNPDIIIATPGRFMHLKVEMSLELKSIQYIVFDEADRLFELGFAEQLNELISSLPTSRQTLLFSATLPRTLVDFAKAGLSNPTLIRLDAETKISDQLQMAFFTTKNNEREANLLYILQEVIKMPLPTREQIDKIEAQTSKHNPDDSEDSDNDVDDDDKNKKGKSKFKNSNRKFKKERLPPANVLPSEFSTVVFVPTKHHVEFITNLLKNYGYLVSFIYGSLDQRARDRQLYQFRVGLSSIMVVTDVAARGIDIPVLANVINFSFPSSSKIFVHRVGRTARAGNKGWAYSIISEKELPYMLDLEIFLGKKILLTPMHEQRCQILKDKLGNDYKEPIVNYTDRLVLGSVPRLDLENCQEVYENLMRNSYELKTIREVSVKGEKLFYKTRQAASTESVKRAKEIVQTYAWDDQHVLFGPNLEKEKEAFLNKLTNRNSKQTVFEFNRKANEKDESGLTEFMNRRRKQLAPVQRKAKERRELLDKERLAGLTHGIENEIFNQEGEVGYSVKDVDDNVPTEELENYFQDGEKMLTNKENQRKKSFKDPQFFMSHYAPSADIQDKQLALDSSFSNNAANAAFDLDNDDKSQVHKQVYQWNKKKGKYTNSYSTDQKYIISESGQRIPATYKSGKYEEWKKIHGNSFNNDDSLGLEKLGYKKFKHKKVKAPQLPDKYRDDYHKQKKKVDKALSAGIPVKGHTKAGQSQELKSTEDIRKARQIKEKRREKNARPSKKRKY